MDELHRVYDESFAEADEDSLKSEADANADLGAVGEICEDEDGARRLELSDEVWSRNFDESLTLTDRVQVSIEDWSDFSEEDKAKVQQYSWSISDLS